ncbi:hypothetical protein [Achromobacter insolitus]|uniref:hypothetical protein n=1 Tax=Achromobacter insolitus TaxID=217204 RepID=UPI0007C40D1E|nr:hypothetical protein [Achromobacter insolitus]OAD16435.1 hypothetical protein A3839_28180 [Achromobacter insolitus]
MMNQGRYHWSNLAREVLFFVIHWAAGVPWIAMIFYQSWTLLGIAILTTAAMIYIRFVAKMTLASAWRGILSSIGGREKATNNWFKEFIRQR